MIPRTILSRLQLKPISRTFSSVSSTINKNEIKKFDKFSTDQYNWYTSELTKPLRNLNKLRIPLIKGQLLADKQFKGDQIIQNLPLKNFNLLDIGCGGGLLSECLARLGANVTAIDANEKNIQFAQDHFEKIKQNITGQLNYVHSDLTQFAKTNAQEQTKFDALIASEILEHVNNVEEFISNCSKLLKDNGLLFITTINQTAQSYLFAILLAENVLKLAPKNTHQYNMLVLLNGLSLILKESK